MIFGIIISGLFLVALTLLIIRNSQYVKVKEKCADLKKFESLSNLIQSNQREGFYDEKLNSQKQGPGFATVRVSVIELEKYTNGMSKIQHTKFQYLTGPSNTRDECLAYVKDVAVDLMLTSSITFLEVEESIKEKRLKKLKELESNL